MKLINKNKMKKEINLTMLMMKKISKIILKTLSL